MIQKAEGLVLRVLKYQDSSLIVKLYTREFGVRDFIVKGARSTKGKLKTSYFQPLHHLDVLFYEKQGRDLQTLTETAFKSYYTELTQHPVKMVYGLLLAEVFTCSLLEPEPNPQLFDFLLEELREMDTAPAGIFGMCCHCLLHLSGHLGFLPHVADDAAQQLHFDPQTGTVEPVAFRVDQTGRFVADLLSHDVRAASRLVLSGAERKAALAQILRFYAFHVDGFRQPLSLSVFEQVFQDA